MLASKFHGRRPHGHSRSLMPLRTWWIHDPHGFSLSWALRLCEMLKWERIFNICIDFKCMLMFNYLLSTGYVVLSCQRINKERKQTCFNDLDRLHQVKFARNTRRSRPDASCLVVPAHVDAPWAFGYQLEWALGIIGINIIVQLLIHTTSVTAAKSVPEPECSVGRGKPWTGFFKRCICRIQTASTDDVTRALNILGREYHDAKIKTWEASTPRRQRCQLDARDSCVGIVMYLPTERSACQADVGMSKVS